MRTYRPSISPDAFAKLAYLAAKAEISPGRMIELMVDEAWSRRDEMPDSPKSIAAAMPERKSEKRIKRQPIMAQPELVQRLDEMKAAGNTTKDMAVAIGYPAGSIRSYFAWKAKRI